MYGYDFWQIATEGNFFWYDVIINAENIYKLGFTIFLCDKIMTKMLLTNQ